MGDVISKVFKFLRGNRETKSVFHQPFEGRFLGSQHLSKSEKENICLTVNSSLWGKGGALVDF